MPSQTAGNASVRIKRETVTGEAATAAGADEMRLLDSPGMELTRAQITSGERRGDMIRALGRLGGKQVNGSYNLEATVGGVIDMLLESIQRGTWAAAVAITEATAGLTSITTTTNTIVASAGSWLTAGVRVGDVVTLTNHSTAGNNDLRLRVTGVTATVLTLAGTPLTANAVADSAFTLTILKKLVNPTSPTRYSHTIEQYYEDIDLAELFLGCRLTGLTMSLRPGAPVTITATFVGMDRTVLVEGTSPWFTAPSITTGLALVSDDSAIRLNGADIATLTGFDLNFEIASSADAVIGSFVPPDVFDNELAITGTVTGIRSDFARVTLFDEETEFEISVLLTEPGDDPKPALGLYMPRVKIASLSAPVLGGEGAQIETMGIMVGPAVAAADTDASAVNFFSSAA